MWFFNNLVFHFVECEPTQQRRSRQHDEIQPCVSTAVSTPTGATPTTGQRRLRHLRDLWRIHQGFGAAQEPHELDSQGNSLNSIDILNNWHLALLKDLNFHVLLPDSQGYQRICNTIMIQIQFQDDDQVDNCNFDIILISFFD